MENRNKLTVTGVIDINSFNEQLIEAITEMGTLIIKGEGLHINKLNKDSKDLCVDGKISSLVYQQKVNKSGASLFKSMFK
jgi:sporulation protein YabP